MKFMRIILITLIELWISQTIISQESTMFGSSHPSGLWIHVIVSEQILYVLQDDSVIAQYPVSTSKYGIGNRANSFKTPIGWHRICSKIGSGEPLGMIFEGCRPSGQIAEIITDTTDVAADWITTRILRLEGLEPGINTGEGIDSYKRCIYIHGTHEEGLIGVPVSHGCIRLRNKDMLDLFEVINEKTLVKIDK
jgi:lipoprotein-anchoring transpeptidase ErfK/SrfK